MRENNKNATTKVQKEQLEMKYSRQKKQAKGTPTSIHYTHNKAIATTKCQYEHKRTPRVRERHIRSYKASEWLACTPREYTKSSFFKRIFRSNGLCECGVLCFCTGLSLSIHYAQCAFIREMAKPTTILLKCWNIRIKSNSKQSSF